MNVTDDPSRKKVQRGLLLIAVAIVMSIVVGWRAAGSSAPIPVDVVLTDTHLANESSCVECHEQAETFWDTGHAQTLRKATAKGSLELLKKLLESDGPLTENTSSAVKQDCVVVRNVDGANESSAELSWCVGSGRHAKTWVATLNDSRGTTDLLEFRWSWFHSIDDFAVTPGQPETLQPGYFGGLGLLFDQPKAWKCFSCHATHVPVADGKILEAGIHPGVTCQRCHGPLKDHVELGSDVTDKWWSSGDRMGSVHRCAQCHRRAEEHEASEITMDNKDIARFQPVGLIQSKCFTESQMTCVTCHDPHKTMETQDSLGDWQCIQCHESSSDAEAACHAGHTKNCLPCHMPRLKMDAPLSFTDHWIRVRDEETETK